MRLARALKRTNPTPFPPSLAAAVSRRCIEADDRNEKASDQCIPHDQGNGIALVGASSTTHAFKYASDRFIRCETISWASCA